MGDQVPQLVRVIRHTWVDLGDVCSTHTQHCNYVIKGGTMHWVQGADMTHANWICTTDPHLHDIIALAG